MKKILKQIKLFKSDTMEDLEHLMMDMDKTIYNRIKSKIGGSKPVISFQFAEQVMVKNPSVLDSLKNLLLHAVNKVQN